MRRSAQLQALTGYVLLWKPWHPNGIVMHAMAQSYMGMITTR